MPGPFLPSYGDGEQLNLAREILGEYLADWDPDEIRDALAAVDEDGPDDEEAWPR
jgi:hypothetical protein